MNVVPEQLATWVIAGAGGALLRLCLLHQGRLVMPAWGRTPKGRFYLDLGFLSGLLIGVGAAILADHTWVTAFCAAIAGPHLLEAAVSRVAKVKKEA